REQGLVRPDARPAVDVQTDPVAEEIDEQQADVSVLGDVAEAGVDAVAAVLRVKQRPLAEDADEPLFAGPERTITLAPAVRRSDEEHLLFDEELPHGRVEVVEHLVQVKRPRAGGGAQLLLEAVLAPRAG